MSALVSELETVKDTILQYNKKEITEALARFILHFAYRASGVWIEDKYIDEVLGIEPECVDSAKAN